ncbi:MAG: DUF58 domain-containing protein [Butyrivibrio sp.]|nr:DUF58 domain-containing protein [Butyrivibrio sp.]MBQ7430098.1 DUF58 domain-containing protein [Butyrivibrio sp.]
MPIFLIPIGLVLLFLLEKTIYKRYWNRDLKVKIKFQSQPVVEGNMATLTEEITNRNFLPLHILQARFQTNNGLNFVDASNMTVSDRTTINDVFSIGFYEKLTRNLNIRCDKRGYYTILATSLTAADLFSNSNYYMELPQHTSMYVYPKFLKGDYETVVYKQLMGDIVTKRSLYEDHFTFRGIREYTMHDPMSDVNWKASARTGSLKVNLHDQTSGRQVLILLNLDEPAILYETELMEDCIRLAATIASDLINEHIPVGVISNGLDRVTDQRIEVEEGASRGHLNTILQSLARIELSKERTSFYDIVEKEIYKKNDKVTYIVISTSQRKESAEVVERLAEEAGKIMWLLPLTKSMEVKLKEYSNIDFIRIVHE